MRDVELVFAIGWAAFWIYWFVAAFSMKRGRVAWSREIRIRLVIIAVAVVAARLGAFHDNRIHTNNGLAALGLVLWATGLLFSIWARVHLGRNWGAPMTQKKSPELITSGPYRLVLHPIYAGILATGVGTAVGLSWFWLVAVALAAIYFVYAATVEERFMAEQFPDAYPRYKQSTKMLVPYVL